MWKAFIEFKKQGKVKHIGVSNFLPKHIDQIVKATGEKPVVNQILHHPYIVLQEVVDYCRKHNILVEAWSPLGKGNFGILNDKAIVEIAKKHKKTPAQVILRWNIQNGHVVIPKSKSKERQQENLNIFDFELSAAEIKQLDILHNDHKDIDKSNIKNMFVE